MLFLLSIKGATSLGYRIFPSYNTSCENKIVMLSIHPGGNNAILYIYNIFSKKLDSAAIPLGRAPEEVSLFGINSLVCDGKFVYVYDRLGRKINYYDAKGTYRGQFLLTKTPYYMVGAKGHLLLLGAGYLVHVDIANDSIEIKTLKYNNFSPQDMWLGTVYCDTALFFEGTGMKLLKFNLKNGNLIGAYEIEPNNKWNARIEKRETPRGGVSLLPVAAFSKIIKYKNWFVLQRYDHKNTDKNVLLMINTRNNKIEKYVKFPRTAFILAYFPKKDLFYIIDEHRELSEISPEKLGIASKK